MRANESILTRTLCGTPAYLAPEVWGGMKYGKSVDVWSAGCIFFELLVGKGLFMLLKEKGLRVETREDVKGVVEGSQEVPKVMKGLLLGMLEVEPRKRMTAKEALGGVLWLLDRKEELVKVEERRRRERVREWEEREKKEKAEKIAKTRAWKKRTQEVPKVYGSK